MLRSLVLIALLAPALGAQGVAHPVPRPIRKAPAKVKPVELNSASVQDLQQLPGISEALARKIVAGRPYRSKANLVTRGILPEAVYQALRKRVTVVPPPLPGRR